MTALSSRLTPFMKFGFPALWGGMWSYGTALMFIDPSHVHWHGGGAPPSWAKWVFLGFLILLGVGFGRVCLPLKRVALDDDYLVVSNYFRTIRIPLANVQTGGFDPDSSVEVGGEWRSLVALEFNVPTDFGDAIEFIPRSRETLGLLRTRLGWSTDDPRPEEKSELAEELRGRGTV